MRCFKDVDQLDQAFKFAVWGFFVNRLECKLMIEILEMGYIGVAPTEESFFFLGFLSSVFHIQVQILVCPF